MSAKLHPTDIPVAQRVASARLTDFASQVRSLPVHFDLRLEDRQRRLSVTLCPVALAVGCKKCPLFKICPAKEIIGDYKKSNADNRKAKGDSGEASSND